MAGLGFSNTEFSAMLNVPVEKSHEEEASVVEEPSGAEAPAADAPGSAPTTTTPALPLPDIKKMGAWQKHTKGFGMKMLAKMGFRGRLGKDEQGVAAPVAVKARPNQMGLGFGDFKEAVTLKQNKEIERDLHGKGEDDDDDDATREHMRDDGAWRKRLAPTTHGGRKRKRKTVQDVLAEEKSAIDLIVDMRGPLAQVYTDGHMPTSTATPTEPLLGQEILYNVRHVVNQTEGTIRGLNSKISVDRARLVALQAAHETDAAAVAQTARRGEHLGAITTALAELQAFLASVDPNDDDGHGAAIDAIADTAVTLRTKYPVEFGAHHVVDVVPSLAIPLLKAAAGASTWHPLRVDAAALRLRGHFVTVRACLTTCVAPPDARDVGVFATNIDSATRHDKIYDHMVAAVLVPRLVAALHRWRVEDAEAGLALVDYLRTFIPAAHVQRLLTDHILPRLTHAVRTCQHAADVERLHDWLLPWRVHFESSFAHDVYPVIRETLARTLQAWHPQDTSVFTVLLPWKDVWAAEDFAVFTHKHIVKKLVRVLNREFAIDPRAQELAPLEWVLAWHRVLPDRQFVALLEAEFFTKWLKVLADWIEQNTSAVIPEVMGWYLGWKALFDELELLHEERICMQFHGALQLMQCIAAAPTLPGLKLLPLTYEDALLRGKKRAAAAPVHPKFDLHAVNMRDVVEEFALQHNIEFAPVRAKTRDGQVVYSFGKQHIVIDQSVVFVETAKGQFDPIDIDDLVKKA
ncbi:Aste57867_14381 [Aphanomyces stellatus]|uniref:Aste57867_14381 protein n=1 Tax=Aphanomyces stellatus TaxID=120398 RepID=A0A485L1L3_9STRA|nr:hypothetical protein As57867_014327 [Aphanomyces stellatus]VFT91204.1 Aste57867_14381 [Aphanomyces stellatus]